jgi:hypothetical protein
MSTMSPTLLLQSVSVALILRHLYMRDVVVPVGLQVGREADLTLLTEVAREGILKSSLATVQNATKSMLAVTYPGAGTETVGVTHFDGFLALRVETCRKRRSPSICRPLRWCRFSGLLCAVLRPQGLALLTIPYLDLAHFFRSTGSAIFKKTSFNLLDLESRSAELFDNRCDSAKSAVMAPVP